MFPKDGKRFDNVDNYNDVGEFDPENVFGDDEKLGDIGFDGDDRNSILKRFLEMVRSLMILVWITMRFDRVGKNYQRLCDHCHNTSKYRRAANNLR